ncbi:homoserine dehydrogenase [Rhodoferax sp.]|uniref:homoserine dehydrogenase n=1 Tax=Rhodoferax sp. TaxID=50421 RepID=UPI00261E4B8A|nr:homoserine dehydrogenase [Rhodoferax sp.]MDD2927023.1 homoserine dehydrogenase [Rhodoferax sp.]
MYQDQHASFSVGQHTQPACAVAPLRVGMIGLGTVGAGTYRVLQRNAGVIAARTGRRIEIRMVAVRHLARAAGIVTPEVLLTDDPFAVVNDPGIDVVVEVMGGTGLARELVLQAISQGKHVVTANKALLAEHGSEIFAAAQAQGVVVAYEGAVAVSIPIIKALREGLAANHIQWVAGIINGTTNYILSEMQAKGLGFAAALAEAQRLGYAEADPALDVQGLDAAHKLTLLAANAFGVPVRFDQVYVEGITTLDALDIRLAGRLGYCVKLLGIARRTPHGLELRVHPTLIAADHLLAQVHGAMNAVLVKSDAAGITMYYGAGAGAEPTASAVIADLVDVCRVAGTAPRQRVPHLAFQPDAIQALPVAAIDALESRYYLRLDVVNPARTVAQLLGHLAVAGVSVQQLDVTEHPGDPGWSAVVLLTDPTPERVLRGVLAELAQWPNVMGFASTLRMEALN